MTRTGIGSLRAGTVKTADHRAPQRNTEKSETNSRKKPICVQKRKKSSAGKLSGPPGFTFSLDRSHQEASTFCRCCAASSPLTCPCLLSCVIRHSGSHGPHRRRSTSPSRCVSCPQTGLRSEDMTFFYIPLKTFFSVQWKLLFPEIQGGGTTRLHLTS